MTQLIIQGGVGAGLIVCVTIFVRYIQGRDKADAEREARMQDFMSNHLTKYVQTMDSIGERISELGSGLREVRWTVESCPHNREAAAQTPQSKEQT